VEALNGCRAKSNTGEQRQSYRVLAFHETISVCEHVLGQEQTLAAYTLMSALGQKRTRAAAAIKFNRSKSFDNKDT
jgi:hypothetical protein